MSSAVAGDRGSIKKCKTLDIQFNNNFISSSPMLFEESLTINRLNSRVYSLYISLEAGAKYVENRIPIVRFPYIF
jgi:hypothetical protein